MRPLEAQRRGFRLRGLSFELTDHPELEADGGPLRGRHRCWPLADGSTVMASIGDYIRHIDHGDPCFLTPSCGWF